MGVDAQMLVKTRQPFTQREVRNLSVALVEAFWTEPFLLMPDWKPYPLEEGEAASEFDPEPGVPGRHALRLVPRYVQDGDDIEPEPGESLIEVSLWGRYYGEGYERGPLWLYIAIAEWLEHRIPDARVFYGGDSSGVCAEPFDAKARAALFAYFATHGHKPYRGAFGGSTGPACGFCGPRMIGNGGSRNYSFYVCLSCDAKAVVHHGTGAVEPVTDADRAADKVMGGLSAAAQRLVARSTPAGGRSHD